MNAGAAIGANGTWTFQLFDQMDHDPPNDNTTDGVSNGPGSDQNTDLQDSLPGTGDVTFIEFGNIIQATDADGDSITLDGKVQVTITDDIPVNNTATPVSVTVHEDALNNFDATFDVNGDKIEGSSGNSAGEGTKTTSATITAASLAAEVSVGADEPAAFSLNLVGDALRDRLDPRFREMLGGEG